MARINIQTKLIVFACSVLALLAGSTVVTLWIFAGESAHREAIAASHQTRILLKRVIGDKQGRLFSDAHVFADSSALADMVARGDRGGAADQAAIYLNKMPSIDGVLLANAAGDLVAGAGAAPHALPWKGDAKVGVAESEGRLYIGARRELAGGKGSVFAVSLLDDQRVAQILPDTNSEILLTVGGKIVASTLPHPDRPPVISDPGPVSFMDTDYYAVGGTFVGSKSDAVLGYVTLWRSPTSLRLKESLLTAIAVGFFLITALAIFVTTLVAANLVDPVVSATEAIDQMRKGRWPKSLPSDRRDELGDLNVAINRLSTEQRERIEVLETTACTDSVTGLLNRTTMMQEVAKHVGQDGGLVVVTFRNLPRIGLGHGVAEIDAFLERASRRLRRSLGHGVPCARWTSDSFAVLLTEEDDELRDRVTRVRLEMDEEFRHEPIEIPVGYGYVLNRESSYPENLAIKAELASISALQADKEPVLRGEGVVADEKVLLNYLRDGNLHAITMLAESVDSRELYSQGHSRRIAALAVDFAKYLEVNEDFQDLLYRTALLKDLGNMAIPLEILSKNEVLTESERDHMERHVLLSEHMVKAVPHLADALPGVLAHHERWDGKGYPYGLSGAQIPLEARILALADTFDAMTQDRAYRKGLPLKMALKLITAGGGSQFDPGLTKAFVKSHQIQGPLQKVA